MIIKNQKKAERQKLNKIEEENSKYDSNSGSKNEKISLDKNIKNKILFKKIIVNKTLNTEKNKIKIPTYSSKTFNTNNQEQKEILRKINRNNNIHNYVNSKENKTLQLESENLNQKSTKQLTKMMKKIPNYKFRKK